MSPHLSPAALALSDDYQLLLLKYRPQCLSESQWTPVRADVLDLVAKCCPRFPKEVAMLAGVLCKLIATFADQVERPTVSDLLTQTNVDALLGRFDLAGMPSGTHGQQQVRLRRLLRTHLGTPKPGPAAPRPTRDLHPYNLTELSELVAQLELSPAPVRQSGLNALLLGLSHGIVLPDTEDVTADAQGRLVWKGRVLPEPQGHWGSKLVAHHANATPLSRSDWQGVRAWLAWQHPHLDLSAQRLRDTWLLFCTSTVAGLTPVVALMADGVGRERLMRAAEEPLESPDTWQQALRDF